MTTRTVLIADDDPQVRQALRVRLEAMGYRVLECFDGLGAIAKGHDQRVDAIILDHEMPLGEGRDIATSIRAFTDAPIIFLSGHDREEFREIVTRLPEAYYLPKPLEEGRLQTLLESVTQTTGWRAG